jgi:hypothetical protein
MSSCGGPQVKKRQENMENSNLPLINQLAECLPGTAPVSTEEERKQSFFKGVSVACKALFRSAGTPPPSEQAFLK